MSKITVRSCKDLITVAYSQKICDQYLSIVAFEIANILKGIRGEELNEGGVGSSK